MRLPKRLRSQQRSRGGFTLLETMIAAGMFTGIGYVLILSTQASEGSHETVTMNAASNGAHRAIARQLRDELRSARRASVQLNQPDAGNATIRFEMAIESPDASPGWGVFDRQLDIDENECHKAGWSVQYSVEQGGLEPNELVRRVLDINGNTQLMHTLTSDVVRFQVDTSGDVWVVSLETLGDEGRRQDEFDVLIRNQ